MSTKEEYLKRYLSKSDDQSKGKDGSGHKRKKIKIAKHTGLKILDDDFDLKATNSFRRSGNEKARTEGHDDDDEETPTVADFIDERPDSIKQLEAFRQNKNWKILGAEDHFSLPTTSSKRHDSDEISRTFKSKRDEDSSPPRRLASKLKSRHDSDSDNSPPRRDTENQSSQMSSHQRNIPKTRHDSDSDLSPPRVPINKRSDSTAANRTSSGQRRTNQSLDLSPRRVIKKERHDSDSDVSPRRKRASSDSDLSPPRMREDHDSDLSPPRKRQKSSDDSDLSPPRRDTVIAMKTMSGATAGLQSARDMVEETRRLKAKEDTAFHQMDDSLLGRNAPAVLRDKKSGKRRDLVKEQKMQDIEDEKKQQAAAKYKEWNKGLKQKELQTQRAADALHEVDKPLARYKDDVDLDALLRAQERHDELDPMLAFIKRKKLKNKTGAEKPRYSGREPPPNRFNIWPGYRWDGVDRSNGFEKQFFAKTVERQVVKDMAYKWSVEDM